MTTIYEVEKICAVCGETSSFNQVGSTNAFGPSDLDIRPPEMKRSTIDMWVQQCTKCGYCSPDISELLENAEVTVKSNEYIYQLHKSDFSQLANKFLCLSQIYEAANDIVKAGWACVYAAWVHDDEGQINLAKENRIKALQFFVSAKDKQQQVFGQLGVLECFIADLLRRSEQFDAVLDLCNKTDDTDYDDVVKSVLAYQKELSQKNDCTCHTIEDALNTRTPKPSTTN